MYYFFGSGGVPFPFKNFSKIIHSDSQIAAEDIIVSHILDQILARSTGSFSEYIQKLIEEMEDLIETKVIRFKETIGEFKEDRNFVDFSPAALSRLVLHMPSASFQELAAIVVILGLDA